jgi:hypothetical protein
MEIKLATVQMVAAVLSKRFKEFGNNKTISISLWIFLVSHIIRTSLQFGKLKLRPLPYSPEKNPR